MSRSEQEPVRAWREKVSIPTYATGEPNKNPMFLERRVYQGSSGAVYPIPVVDRVDKTASPVEWDVVFLENEFLRVMLMPQLGGRVQMAVDKTNDYHFVYYNRVIKPALVGLAGPWISGGIEFNWPQHHRPGTYSPVDCDIEEHADGTVTVWMHEIDRMYGTRGTHGLRLSPGRAALEVDARLSNRTRLDQTFLWWANPAVHVDENHQSIFPPDVHAVLDHGKRDVSEFPIAKGEYYKVDYAPGTDISRYKNIPVPTSYMAYHSDYNFVGSYDHGRQAGLLHVADHHVSPGKKQWTWGCGEFGKAWDRQLTDDSGPYIELMCGVYTDNQPDFSWLAPGEEKRFTQRFMPYKGVGEVKNATADAAIGYECEPETLKVRVWPVARFDQAVVRVLAGDGEIASETVDLSPERCEELTFEAPVEVSRSDCRIEVVSGDRVLVACRTGEQPEEPIPEPAEPIGEPSEVESVEALVLAGRHLEQYRHATREPESYYREALRREPTSAQANHALGALLLRRGRLKDAERAFRAAIATLTKHNPNPSTGESHVKLGHCLALQQRFDAAYDVFAKAAWNREQRGAASFELARIAIGRGDEQDAHERLDEALTLNARHHQATHLRVALLVTQGRAAEAKAVIDDELRRDPFNFGVLFEQAKLSDDFSNFDSRSRGELNTVLELSLDYAAAAMFDQAIEVLDHAISNKADGPMLWYYHAAFCRRANRLDEAAESQKKAQAVSIDYCFPNKLEEFSILDSAVAADASDGRAHYLLGLLWFSRAQDKPAIACWERAAELVPGLATVWRNLGLAYYNKRGNGAAAWQALNRAFEINPTDARVLYELDQLANRLGHPLEERLTRLETHRPLLAERDDLRLEWVRLMNSVGRCPEALEAILAYEWRPWEGGEGKVPAQYEIALTSMATERLAEGKPAEALELIQQAAQWPACLGEGKLWDTADSRISYLHGVALAACSRDADAEAVFRASAEGRAELGDPAYYNDLPPDTVFYQGLALQAAGRLDEAVGRFEALIAHGESKRNEKANIDYFAVSLPDFLVFDDDLDERNRIHCEFVIGLGRLGLAMMERGEYGKADKSFAQVLEAAPDHQGALIHRRLLGASEALLASV